MEAALALVEQPATRINNLHKELREYGQSMVQKAIQAGGLLVEQKEKLGHGLWLPWVERDLIFSARTAQHYIKCYQHRDELNTKCVSHLGEAVKLLASPKKDSLFELSWEDLREERELAQESQDWPTCKVCGKNKVMYDNCSPPEPKRHGLCEDCNDQKKEERKAQKTETRTANALESKCEFEETPVDPEAEKSCMRLVEFLTDAVNGILDLNPIIGKVSDKHFDCLTGTISRLTGVLYDYQDEILNVSTYEGET